MYGLPWTHSKQKHAKISESNFHTFGWKPKQRQKEGGALWRIFQKSPPSRFIWAFARPACHKWKKQTVGKRRTFLFSKLILTVVSFVTTLVLPPPFSDPKRLRFLVTCRKCVLTSKQGRGWLRWVSGAAVASMFGVAAGQWGQERGEVCFIINSVLHDTFKCHAL